MQMRCRRGEIVAGGGAGNAAGVEKICIAGILASHERENAPGGMPVSYRRQKWRRRRYQCRILFIFARLSFIPITTMTSPASRSSEGIGLKIILALAFLIATTITPKS